jgi:hypothetical protein
MHKEINKLNSAKNKFLPFGMLGGAGLEKATNPVTTANLAEPISPKFCMERLSVLKKHILQLKTMHRSSRVLRIA